MQPMELLMYILPLLDSMLIQQTVLRNIKKNPIIPLIDHCCKCMFSRNFDCYVRYLVCLLWESDVKNTWKHFILQVQISRYFVTSLQFVCQKKWQLGLFWGKYIWNSNKLLCYILTGQIFCWPNQFWWN